MVPVTLTRAESPGSAVWLTGDVAHSIELLPDDAADTHLRAQWAVLAEAGLPSAADIRSATNRPHLTLLATDAIPPAADTAVLPVAQRLPIRAALGAPIVFGRGARHTLARLVLPSTELLSLQAHVLRVTGPLLSGEVFAHFGPGAWTPHITLARNLSAEHIGRALAALESSGPGESGFTFDALRRWDSDTRSDHITPGRAC